MACNAGNTAPQKKFLRPLLSFPALQIVAGQRCFIPLLPCKLTLTSAVMLVFRTRYSCITAPAIQALPHWKKALTKVRMYLIHCLVSLGLVMMALLLTSKV